MIKFVVLIFLFKSLNCETVSDVIKEFEPKVQLLIGDIKIALGESGSEIGATKSAISRNIYSEKDRLYNKLKIVKTDVENAISSAESSGKNVTHCIENFNSQIENFNLEVIRKCHSNKDIYEVQKEMNLLRDLLKNAEILIDGCVGKFPSDDQIVNLRHCLVLGIDVIRSDIGVRQKAISTGLVVALASSNECIATTSAELESSIREISNNFDKCVESVN